MGNQSCSTNSGVCDLFTDNLPQTSGGWPNDYNDYGMN